MNFVFKKLSIPLGVAFLAGIVLIARQASSRPDEDILVGVEDAASDLADQAGSPRPSVTIGGVPVMVEIATTSAAVQKGLSGRASLGQDQGMLFIFSQPDRYRFWMPDMRFPIDIIWIADDKVAEIDENVSNRFDPANPVFFAPSVPVRHVLEVNAGFSKKYGIAAGDAVISRTHLKNAFEMGSNHVR